MVGAGPAGLMAAERLAQSGCKVTIADKMPSPGRKFLMAGKSGLNLTKVEATSLFHRSYREAEPWLRPMLAAFGPDRTASIAAGSSGRERRLPGFVSAGDSADQSTAPSSFLISSTMTSSAACASSHITSG